MRALICGISGQDGAYLARLLLEKGYEVYGTSRDAQVSSFAGLTVLGIRHLVKIESMVLTDFRSVLQTVSRVQPDEIYNLSGQSSVGLSFQQPVETLESIALGTLNLIEVVRYLGTPAKLYNASSGECFGEVSSPLGADESTPFRPKSPYAVAKAAAFWMTANYREAYGMRVCSGILFNHESPLRPTRFVTRKIAAAVARIANGSCEKLALGDIDIRRDWGWAEEYVVAMWRMLQRDKLEDFVIATGRVYSLRDFVQCAFEHVGKNWEDHVVVEEGFLRPTDIRVGFGNPAKAKNLLGWQAELEMPSVARQMVEFELQGFR